MTGKILRMVILLNRQYNVLSIDGGGIRGIIPCMILEKIQEELIKEGKKGSLSDHFNLMSGTSTGGIIALGLSLPDKKHLQNGRRGTRAPRNSVHDLKKKVSLHQLWFYTVCLYLYLYLQTEHLSGRTIYFLQHCVSPSRTLLVLKEASAAFCSYRERNFDEP